MKERPLSSTHRFSAALLRRLDGVWVELSPDLARQLAQKSTAAIAATIRHNRERTAERAEAVAYRRMEQALLIEQREAERRNRALWRRVKIKTPKEHAPERKPHRPTRSGYLAGGSALPSYSGAIIDRLGRQGIFLRIRYYGRKTTRPGVGRRAAIYIYQGAVENTDGSLCVFSNVAETPQEAIAAMELLEQVNREASVDAKLLFHIIVNLPHDLTREQMLEEVTRFAEAQFGCRDLPYMIALHPPSPDGDQRNWHAHILASTRPMRRVDDHEWELGQQLRTEIDNPEAFRRMRELYADIQTEVAREAGLDRTYTALSNVGRGLPVKPQEHLGGVRADLVRRGETVAACERNRETVVASARAMLDERLRHEQEDATRQAALIGRALARLSQTIHKVMLPALPVASRPIGIRRVDAGDSRSALARPVSDVPIAPVMTASIAVSNLKPANVSHPTDGPALSRSFQNATPLSVTVPPSRTFVSVSATTAGIRIAAPPVVRATGALLPPTPARSSRLSGPVVASRPPLEASAIPLPTDMIDTDAQRSGLVAQPVPFTIPRAARVHLFERDARLPPTVPRQAAIVPRPSPIPTVIPMTEPDGHRVLSRSSVRSRPVMARVEPIARVMDGARLSNDGLAGLMLLIARRSADVKRRKIERERSAAVEMARQRADLERLRTLDPLVREFARKGLSVSDDVLRALGRDQEWERSAPVQQILAEMLDDQNDRIGRLEMAPDGTPPVAVVNGRPVPADHLAPDLARSVERWSDDASFRAVVAQLWPTPPPTAARPVQTPEPLFTDPRTFHVSEPVSPQVASPPISVEQAWRWAAAYRERLMLASDALRHWDRSELAPGPQEELDRPNEPGRMPASSAARLGVRNPFDVGRGG